MLWCEQPSGHSLISTVITYSWILRREGRWGSAHRVLQPESSVKRRTEAEQYPSAHLRTIRWLQRGRKLQSRVRYLPAEWPEQLPERIETALVRRRWRKKSAAGDTVSGEAGAIGTTF